MSTPDMTEEIVYCTVHPDREATLRCNKCGRPMCVQCAVQTPVGYRCRECVRGIQAKYYNANPYDEWIAFGVAALATGIAAYLIMSINVPLFFLIILGFPVGGAVSELIVRVVQKRRSRTMAAFALAGAVLGGLLGALLQVYIRVSGIYAQARGSGQLPPLDVGLLLQLVFSDIGLLLAIGIIAAAIYTRLRMRG